MRSQKHKLKGVKLYTAEWRGESKGYKLTDKASYQYLEAAQKLGIKNIHVHKGPTIIPLNRDAFDVADIDDVATVPGLNFIVEHCGLPRLDDFCWIATQETNVYAGLAVALPFIHSRPGYFAQVISELLFWVGPDKILYGSDYGIWTPKWLIDKFMALEIPDNIKNDEGLRMTPHGLQMLCNKIGERAKVEHAHPHRWRHTFAIQFLKNGGDLARLKILLGHRSIAVTQIYTKFAQADVAAIHAATSAAEPVAALADCSAPLALIPHLGYILRRR